MSPPDKTNCANKREWYYRKVHHAVIESLGRFITQLPRCLGTYAATLGPYARRSK